MADGQPIRVLVLDELVAANDAVSKPVAALCSEDSACLRWKRYGLPACEGLCARRAFLEGVERARVRS